MTDTKISALAAASSLADTDELVLASAGANKKITGANLKGSMPASGGVTVISYVERTSDVSLSGSPTAIVTAPTLTYAAVLTKFEFFCPYVQGVGGWAAIIELFDGSTSLFRWAAVAGGASGTYWPAFLVRYLTPSAASHTYNVKGWNAAGACVLSTGTGGSGQYVPIFLRISTGG